MLEQEEEKVIEALYFEIDQIMQNPPSEQEIIEFDEQDCIEFQKDLKGEPTQESKKRPGTIEFPDFEIFLKALKEKLQIPDDVAEDIALHEVNHFAIARRENLNPRIAITIFKPSDSSQSDLMLSPSIIFSMPEGSPEERKRIIQKIASAPHNLSDTDRKILGIVK